MTHPETDVLVIGAGGPIGHALVRLLRSEDVAIATTTRSGGEYPLDVRDARQVRDLLSALRPSAVAYLVNPILPTDASVEDVDAWATAARRTAEDAGAVGVTRFIFASSAAVYGDDQPEPRTEDAPLCGQGAYAGVKIASESALASLRGATMTVLSTRIFNVYGPGCAASLINRLQDGALPTMYRTPLFVRDYVHVDEVAGAIRMALRVDNLDVLAVNVGSGRAVSNLMLMQSVPTELYKEVEAPDMRSFSVADPSRAASLLGWRARLDVMDALRG